MGDVLITLDDQADIIIIIVFSKAHEPDEVDPFLGNRLFRPEFLIY